MPFVVGLDFAEIETVRRPFCREIDGFSNKCEVAMILAVFFLRFVAAQ